MQDVPDIHCDCTCDAMIRRIRDAIESEGCYQSKMAQIIKILYPGIDVIKLVKHIE